MSHPAPIKGKGQRKKGEREKEKAKCAESQLLDLEEKTLYLNQGSLEGQLLSHTFPTT